MMCLSIYQARKKRGNWTKKKWKTFHLITMIYVYCIYEFLCYKVYECLYIYIWRTKDTVQETFCCDGIKVYNVFRLFAINEICFLFQLILYGKKINKSFSMVSHTFFWFSLRCTQWKYIPKRYMYSWISCDDDYNMCVVLFQRTHIFIYMYI